MQVEYVVELGCAVELELLTVLQQGGLGHPGGGGGGGGTKQTSKYLFKLHNQTVYCIHVRIMQLL